MDYEYKISTFRRTAKTTVAQVILIKDGKEILCFECKNEEIAGRIVDMFKENNVCDLTSYKKLPMTQRAKFISATNMQQPRFS